MGLNWSTSHAATLFSCCHSLLFVQQLSVFRNSISVVSLLPPTGNKTFYSRLFLFHNIFICLLRENSYFMGVLEASWVLLCLSCVWFVTFPHRITLAAASEYLVRVQSKLFT